MDYKFDLLGGEGMGTRWCTTLAEFTAQLAVIIDPEIEVIYGPLRSLDVGEVQQSQFRLAVAANLEVVHV